ncbi:MAG: transcriptional regulator [Spirochaetia bacterium]
MSELYTQFDSTFFEKTRLSIMTIIFQEDKVSFTQLKDKLNATDGAIYTHLEKLVTGGYVSKTKEIAGTSVQTIYSLTEEGHQTFSNYIQFLETILSQKTGG